MAKILSTRSLATGRGFNFFALTGTFLQGSPLFSRNFVTNKTLFNIGAAVGGSALFCPFYLYFFWLSVVYLFFNSTLFSIVFIKSS
jgi:hypothetical protein